MDINEYIRLKGYKHINNGEGFEHVSHAISIIGILEFKKLVRNFHKDPIVKEIKRQLKAEYEAKRRAEIALKKEIKPRKKVKKRVIGTNVFFERFKENFKEGDITTIKEIISKVKISKSTFLNYRVNGFVEIVRIGYGKIKITKIKDKWHTI